MFILYLFGLFGVILLIVYGIGDFFFFFGLTELEKHIGIFDFL